MGIPSRCLAQKCGFLPAADVPMNGMMRLAKQA